jgi:hypothetical protein
MPYAAHTPNAIDPTAAHTNINKFNKSAIILALIYRAQNEESLFAKWFKNAEYSRGTPAILSEKAAALTLVSIAK